MIVQEKDFSESLRAENQDKQIIVCCADGSRLVYRPGRRDPVKLGPYEPRYAPADTAQSAELKLRLAQKQKGGAGGKAG
jgi:hypothetical protein